MTISEFFIKRPVFAITLNLMIAIIGLLSFTTLNIREYPEVIIPVLNVGAYYPNASSTTTEETVTNVLEDNLSSTPSLDYMSSSTSGGNCQIKLNFKPGTKIDKAMSDLRELISLARSRLPKEVKEPHIQMASNKGEHFFYISLTSDELGAGGLAHYANLKIKNILRSIKGVAVVDVWGQPYVMKITLDPKKLLQHSVNLEHLIEILHRNNVNLPAGKFQNQIETSIDISLSSVSDFENIVLGTGTLLKDVARIELTTNDKDFRARINSKTGLLIGVAKTSDGNLLETSQLIKKAILSMQAVLPGDVKLTIINDQADYIRGSLSNINSAMLEAVLLVMLIIFLFLQNIRAIIIPLVTIPLSLLGVLALMKLCGLSINVITLLAMVLAIGLVVDDAIVVLENIHRHMKKGLTPLQSAIEGSKEISFAITAMTLTLASVYIPIIFYTEPIGQIFAEFAITLSGSVIISGVVALTLSPMMCATMLNDESKDIFPRINQIIFNIENFYQKILQKILPRWQYVIATVLLVLALMIIMFYFLPKEIAPKEDRGYIQIYLPVIPGGNINEQEASIVKIEALVKEHIPETISTLVFVGDWGAQLIVALKDVTERKRFTFQIVEDFRQKLTGLPSTDVYVSSQNSGLPGIDNGDLRSDMSVQIQTTDSYQELYEVLEKLKKTIAQQKIFPRIDHDLLLNTPGYRVKIDNVKIGRQGITPQQISLLLQTFFSGINPLEFRKDGVNYDILLGIDADPWSLDEIYLNSAQGTIIPLSSFAKLTPSVEPASLNHYNQMRSAKINLTANPNYTIPQTMTLIGKLTRDNLPNGYSMTWSGSFKAYSESANTMLMLVGLSLVFIYAILSIQFESFRDPLIIMFTVPLAAFGAFILLYAAGESINIFTQIGLVTLIGLITKHGILMVAFANQLLSSGESKLDAITHAAKLRLRPILMTTLAMIFGSLPLIILSGAGSEARRAIGYVLVGGLSFGTLLTLFIIPSLYLLIKNVRIST